MLSLFCAEGPSQENIIKHLIQFNSQFQGSYFWAKDFWLTEFTALACPHRWGSKNVTQLLLTSVTHRYKGAQLFVAH